VGARYTDLAIVGRDADAGCAGNWIQSDSRFPDQRYKDIHQFTRTDNFELGETSWLETNISNIMLAYGKKSQRIKHRWAQPMLEKFPRLMRRVD
jgi:hypothetical protein